MVHIEENFQFGNEIDWVEVLVWRGVELQRRGLTYLQSGSGTEPSGTGTAGTVLQEPFLEPEPCFPVKLY